MKLEKSAKCIACRNCLGYIWKDNKDKPSYLNCKLEDKKGNSVIKGHFCEGFIHSNNLFEGLHKRKKK